MKTVCINAYDIADALRPIRAAPPPLKICQAVVEFHRRRRRRIFSIVSDIF
jgi:hypothetical protein